MKNRLNPEIALERPRSDCWRFSALTHQEALLEALAPPSSAKESHPASFPGWDILGKAC